MEEFKNQQTLVNTKLESFLETIENVELRDIIRYSIIGGKRLRPIITKSLGDKIGCKQEHLDSIILMTELFHCGSLILDDLPSMDNDNYRRGNETVHLKYGIKNAFLAVNYMFMRAIRTLLIMLNDFDKTKETKFIIDLMNVVFMSNNYTSLGQMIDLDKSLDLDRYKFALPIFKQNLYIDNFFKECKEDIGDILDSKIDNIVLLNLKTFPLFYISFQLPLLLKPNKDYSVNRVINIAFIFSLLFQIADDFEDYNKDKVIDSNNSFIKLIGRHNSYKLYRISSRLFHSETNILDIPILTTIVYLLNKKISVYINQEWIY